MEGRRRRGQPTCDPLFFFYVSFCFVFRWWGNRDWISACPRRTDNDDDDDDGQGHRKST